MSTARNIVARLLGEEDEDLSAYADAAASVYPETWAKVRPGEAPGGRGAGRYEWFCQGSINGVPAEFGFQFENSHPSCFWYFMPVIKLRGRDYFGRMFSINTKWDDMAPEADRWVASNTRAATREIAARFTKPIRGQFPEGVPVDSYLDWIGGVIERNVLRGEERDRLGLNLF